MRLSPCGSARAMPASIYDADYEAAVAAVRNAITAIVDAGFPYISPQS
jgi:hypothetical protein